MKNYIKNEKVYTYLRDYKPFDYQIPSTKLDFYIEKDHIEVISEYELIKKNLNTNKVKFKGLGIKLIEISIDNNVLKKGEYKINNEELIINCINKIRTTLKIKCKVNHKDNKNLLGIYESNKIITTQCEAEGFRRITYHPDRPDILSKYQVKIIADRVNYPILLSNGNLVSNTILDENKHEAIWVDPHPKPSYLFALVAGDLKCITDKYFTKKTKRKININLYVEHGDENYVQHAIDSLKKAMSWDEEKFNLEYDLDSYNIVAIRHFNMGAMENKSLNIFNSKLILASDETSTDDELERIESVVAHEYFHNWTGNRITCRDWFQLSLKEGLTVYRDQEFSGDMHNRDIKRIEDVKLLRKNQFKEDSGPTSHSVQPERYAEIDNFYTTTIYEKGAEIIRMSEAIVNTERFREGFENYIANYDGHAATIDDFIDCIFNNSPDIEVNQFKLWYQQNGTPEVEFQRYWNLENKELTIYMKQKNHNTNNPRNLLPLLIPIRIAIYLDERRKINKLFILKTKEDKLVFNNLCSTLKKPIISVFREFSAPVNWHSDLTLDEELFIIENENDYFTLYDSITRIYKLIIKNRLNDIPNYSIEDKFITSIRSILKKDKEINMKLLSYILSIPNFEELESDIKNIDPIKFFDIQNQLFFKFGNSLKNELLEKLRLIEKNILNIWPCGVDERSLIKVIWKLLFHSDKEIIKERVVKLVGSRNMTLSKAALYSFIKFDSKERELASNVFFNKWKENKLVLDNWFYFKAGIKAENFIENLESLFNHKYFDVKSPNTLRSILYGFVLNNIDFHKEDGLGYQYVAEKVIKFDAINPIVISRFIKVFSHWESYSYLHKQKMLSALEYIDSKKLSKNSREVIDMILKK